MKAAITASLPNAKIDFLAFKMLSMFGSVPVNCALTGHIITAVQPGKLLMDSY